MVEKIFTKTLEVVLMEKMNLNLLANLRYIEEHGAEFFATGASQVAAGLDLNYIPSGNDGGVNLASNGQNLRQSYLIAKHVFEHVKPKTVKFVLIGLSLYSIPESAEDTNSVFNLALADTGENTPPLLPHVTSNEDSTKESFKASAVSDCGKFLVNDEIEKIAAILEDYFKLCVDNGAKPISVLLPVEPTLRKTYKAKILKLFRNTVKQTGKKYKSVFIDLLDCKLASNCFNEKTHLNSTGATTISALLGERLYLTGLISVGKVCEMPYSYFNVLSKYFPDEYRILVRHVLCKMASNDLKCLSETSSADDCKDLMANVFSEMTYDHLVNLSNMLSKDDYNDVAARIFKISAEKIRRKDKIKVGFVLDFAAIWCNDELYNFFARDERFEPTIFLYLQHFLTSNKIIETQYFVHDVEQLRSHNLNVFPMDDANITVPAQDILFLLRPYPERMPEIFRSPSIKMSTLLVHIPYSHSISTRERHRNSEFYRILWKMFFPSTASLEFHVKNAKVGMSRGFYSGYPRMDIFFKNADFRFNWKMTQPDAKKIIWAPHHSIDSVTKYATFQWNYQFIYEYAKAHPEISWVLKPHPNLMINAIARKVFPSIDACKEYFQKWNDLPNAQVYMGGYYQAIFATSDGMIHDSGSFIAEYQYVDKPMIFLTRAKEEFNELGKEILKASYLVDGQDLDGIAAMMQRVFIEGDDYKAAERRAVFDKYLNYPKATGMLASEFIYKNIADELKEV